jgi:hypothetical protein
LGVVIWSGGEGVKPGAVDFVILVCDWSLLKTSLKIYKVANAEKTVRVFFNVTDRGNIT